MLKQSSVNAAFRGQLAKPFLTSWPGWRQRTRHIMSGPAAKGSIEVLDDWDRIQRPRINQQEHVHQILHSRIRMAFTWEGVPMNSSTSRVSGRDCFFLPLRDDGNRLLD